MIFLTEKPNSKLRTDITYILIDSQAEQLVLKVLNKKNNLTYLNKVLTRSFQKYRSNYFPMEAHNFVKVPHYNQTTINTLVGLNCTLYQYFRFNHQPLYIVYQPNSNR